MRTSSKLIGSDHVYFELSPEVGSGVDHSPARRIDDESQGGSGEPDKEKPLFYTIIKYNQEVFRGKRQGHEMPKLSQSIETKMKSVFSNYLDEDRPRVLVAWEALAEYSRDRKDYHKYLYKTEEIKPEDKKPYMAGIYQLNEWATNYATRQYFTSDTNKGFVGKLRSLYGKIGNFGAARFGGRDLIDAFRTVGKMRKVERTAKKLGVNFSDAVFESLFSHNDAKMNALIAQTESVKASNLTELAINIGKRRNQQADEVSQDASSAHVVPSNETPKPANKLVRGINRVGTSVGLLGHVSEPGIARLLLAPNTLTGFVITKFVSVHEAVHAYSQAEDRTGLIPIHLLPSERIEKMVDDRQVTSDQRADL